MQRLTMVRYTTKLDRADENEALSRAVFKELRGKAPKGVGYALFRNGQEFTHLFVNTETDSSDELTELASFKAFSKDAQDRWLAPPEVTRLGLELVESYGVAGR